MHEKLTSEAETTHFRDTRLPKIRNALNDPKLKLNTTSKLLYKYTEYLPQRPKFLYVSLSDKLFQRNWTWTLNSLKYPVYIKYLPLEAQILVLLALIPRYTVIKYQKCTEWPQTEVEHLTVKSTLYTCTKNTYPRCPNFGQFHSITSRFWDTCIRSSKISNAPNMTPNWTWTLNSLKVPCIH